MKRVFKRAAQFVAALLLILVISVPLTIALARPGTPPPIAAVENGSVAAGPDRPLPPYRPFVARDGASLAYRAYPGLPGGGVAVVVHGSSGTSAIVHPLALHLAAGGITVYAPDLRGHGRSGKLGDVDHLGQYQEDMTDLAWHLRDVYPREKVILVGHSSGGSVALRTASERSAEMWDGFLALSPFIAPGAPFSRPDEGGWTDVSVPRIVAISIANGFGVTAFNGLPVMAMAVPQNAGADRARVYSYRLLTSLNLPRDWAPALGAIRKPTIVLIGEADELFYADAYKDEIGRVNHAIDVQTLRGVGHMAMLWDPAALDRGREAAQRLLARN